MNVVYLCRNRLGGIDRMLPILMEIKKIKPELNPLIVFLNEKHRKDIKMNYHLWQGIETVGARTYAMKGKNKFATLIRLIRFIAMLSFRYNIIMKDQDLLPFYNVSMGILKKLSKVIEIKLFLGIQIAEVFKNLTIQRTLDLTRKGLSISSPLKGEYDYLISALSKNELEELGEKPKKLVEVGYVYKMPEWTKFAEAKRVKGDYFLYILKTLGIRRTGLKEPEIIEIMEESLDVLKNYNIKTVFKPQTITDMDKLKQTLKKLNYSNYVIDYGHAFILSYNAKFIFTNIFSTIMCMTYYLGIPSIEYAAYDSELLSKLGGSLGGRFCDFFIQRDKNKLKEVLDKVINGEANINRDSSIMQTSFRNTPREFYEFWHKLLLRNPIDDVEKS